VDFSSLYEVLVITGVKEVEGNKTEIITQDNIQDENGSQNVEGDIFAE